jgi:hypothetical protein
MKTHLVWSAALLLVTLAPLMGCQNEGPAERAGEDVEKVVRDAKDAVSPRGPAEKAGRAIDDATRK